ncbi:hypothetical protein ACW95P_03205 [Candidatus Mycoplasma pogonae]
MINTNNKLKIPTNNDLNINIKKLLWDNKPKNFEEWKLIAEKSFVIKLKIYLKKTNQLSFFSNIYQIIFYYGFINFRKELMLKNLLEEKGYIVKVSSIDVDAVWQVDLIAKKDNKTFYIQLKSNLNLSDSDIKRLKTFAINQNAIPILSIKYKNHFEHKNLLNFQKFIF